MTKDKAEHILDNYRSVTEIDYKDLGPQAARVQAMKDVLDYIGMEEFVRIQQAVADHRDDGPPDKRTWEMIMAYAGGGIAGFPIIVWYELNYGTGSWERAKAMWDVSRHPDDKSKVAPQG